MSKRYDKRIALAIGLSVAAVGALSLLLVPQGGISPPLMSSALFGLGFGAVQVLPYSMMAEVVDQMELRTGERSEGLHYGISDFLRKLGVNLAVVTTTTALSWLGYTSQGTQPEAVVHGIRLIVAIGPPVLCSAAALVILGFPISREVHREIRKQLQDRKVIC